MRCGSALVLLAWVAEAVNVVLPPADWVSRARGENGKVWFETGGQSTLEAVLKAFDSFWREPYVTVFSATQERMSRNESSLEEGLARLVARGESAVFRVEKLQSSRPAWASDEPHESLHFYVSAAGRAALKNHSDTTDVAVFQLAGSKTWLRCDADLVETLAPKLDRCETYDGSEMALVSNCRVDRLEAGEALFVPRRIVHSATADDGLSVHVTVGLRGSKSRKLQATTYEDGCAGVTTACFCELTDQPTADCDRDPSSSDPECPPGTFSPTGYYSSDNEGSCDSSCDASCNSGCDNAGTNCNSGCDDSCDSSCDDCSGCVACPIGRYSSEPGSLTCLSCETISPTEACSTTCETHPPSVAETPPPTDSPTVRTSSSKSKSKKSNSSVGATTIFLIVIVVLVVTIVGILCIAARFYLRSRDNGGTPTAQPYIPAFNVEIPEIKK